MLYTLDKLQFLMSGNITQEFVSMIFRGQEQLLQAVGRDTVMLSLTLVVIAFVLGWWGLRITPTCGGRTSKAGEVSKVGAWMEISSLYAFFRPTPRSPPLSPCAHQLSIEKQSTEIGVPDYAA